MKRVVTGLALGAAAWAFVFLTPKWAFYLVTAGLSAAALHEFFGIASKCGALPFRLVGHVAAAIWLLLPDLDRASFTPFLAIMLLCLAAFAKRPFESVLPAAAATLAGVLYVAGPMHWGIRLHDFSPQWLFLAMLVVAVGDVAAYAIGKRFGRRKLAAHTSPDKTWEGTVASLAASVAVGTWYAVTFLEPGIGAAGAAALAAAVNVAGQVGDLVESALKRGAGIKDSGSLLPGHGGILDRIDGLLLGIPVMYAAARILA